jgi:hypothetical protein
MGSRIGRNLETKQKQRWYFKEKVILDIIPFGEIAKAGKHIYWPPAKNTRYKDFSSSLISAFCALSFANQIL